MKYKSYITDLHVNLHPDQIDLLDKWYQHTKKVADFFTLAYYPYHMVPVKNGFKAEEELDNATRNQQWQVIEDYLKAHNSDDDFISFLGYEWQGTGEDGDHNIYFKDDSGRLLLAPRYQDLVHAFSGLEVMGIPHHLAYSSGNRGKNWNTHNERFSPLVEIYSHHGSSESDETNLSMNRHVHMGPRVDGNTVVDGLKNGYHFGIIASGDNHEVPALVKHGRAGIWASAYTKEALWEAMQQRRTFGFTDSKIITWMELAGQPMGSIVQTDVASQIIRTEVTANNRLERLELYRDGEISQIKLWQPSENVGPTVRFKFQIECGWGPDPNSFPEASSKAWNGRLETTGRVFSVEPVYNGFDNDYAIEDDQHVSFTATTHQPAQQDGWMRDNSLKNEGFIFEIEASRDSQLSLSINGLTKYYSVEEILAASHLLVYEAEAKQLLAEKTGITEYYRSDSWYHNAYKVKLYRGATQSAYQAAAKFTVLPTTSEHSYYVKVVQTNGQTGWSSPIWLSAPTKK